jgi:hypothetical protein
MEADPKQKIDTYVTTKFNAEQQKIYEDARLKAAALPRLGVGNSGYSKFADDRHLHIQAECVRALVLKKVEIHIEAYELYDAIPDDAIIADARMLREMVVAGRSSAVAGELNLEVMRHVRGGEHAKAIAENVRRQLTNQTQYVMNEVICIVEKARVMRSKKRESLPSITVQGPNARVHINSIDASRNDAKG